MQSLDPARKVAMLSDGSELPYELFLGVPVHRVPQVVVESGLAKDQYGWVPVNKQTLETAFPGVYAVGDVTALALPRRASLLKVRRAWSRRRSSRKFSSGPHRTPTGERAPATSSPTTTCRPRRRRVPAGPKPTGTYQQPSEACARKKSCSAPAGSSAGSAGRRGSDGGAPARRRLYLSRMIVGIDVCLEDGVHAVRCPLPRALNHLTTSLSMRK